MNRRQLLYQTVCIVTLLLLLIGCGGSKDKPTPTPVPPTAAPIPTLEPDWTLYEKPEYGFAIALPPRWEQIDMDAQTLEASLEMLGDENPEMATLLSGQASSLVISGIKFFGFDVSVEAVSTGFATNVNVLSQPLGMEMSLDVFTQVTVAQLENMELVKGRVSQRRVNLSTGEAVELKYRMEMQVPYGGTVTIAVTQYAFIRGEDAYVITLGTTEDQVETYAPLFEKIAQSFRLLD